MLYQKFIENTLKSASEIASQMFGKVESKTKADTTAVTQADLAVGELIIEKIKKNFPDHSIIDEEAGVIDKKSNYTWVIDPIDGTANFAVGIPLYGIMIGLLDEDKPIAGGFALPYFKEIYVAEKGQGAFCNGDRLVLQDRSDFSAISIVYGIDKFGVDEEFVREQAKYLIEMTLEFYMVRNSGSIYDIAMMVKGGYGAVLYNTGKIWDNVPQQIVIEEAKGIYTDFLGRPMDYSEPLEKARQKLNYSHCVASPAVHKKLQEIIHSL